MPFLFSFDSRIFWKLVIVSIVLNLLWGFVAAWIGNYPHVEEIGLITGVGYLIIYAVTLFSGLGAKDRTFYRLVVLLCLISGIYLFSSFLVFTPVGLATNNILVAYLCSALVSSFLLMLVADKFFSLKFRWLTGLGVFVTLAAVAAPLYWLTDPQKYYPYDHIFKSMSIIYSTWQISSTIVLAAGMSIR